MSRKVKKNRVALNQIKKKLASFKKYLPVFEKQRAALNKMLQKEDLILEELNKKKKELTEKIDPWVALFNDIEVDIAELIKVVDIKSTNENIFGTTIPVFEDVVFEEKQIDSGKYPFWVPEGIMAVKEIVMVNAQMEVSKQRMKLIKKGYEESNQKVNLFDKKLIPEALEDIKEIKTALDAQGIAAIVIAKSAKKLQERRSAA
jgi:V/A-type H+-transporting ATPase subunit D